MFYFVTIALQGFCIYHSIKYRTAYYWIFLIVFLPVIGSIIYILTQVYNKRDAELITSGVTKIINPTGQIKALEKQVDFSDTYQNRVNLADAYLEAGDNSNALKQYNAALDGDLKSDFYVVKQMMEAAFNQNDFKAMVVYAEGISNHSEFKRSRAQFLYGLALKAIGDLKAAERHLSAIDIRFSYYKERVAFAEFLLEIDKAADAKAVLEAVISEGAHMTKQNKRLYKSALVQAQTLMRTIDN